MQNAGLDETQAGIKMLGEISTTSDIDYNSLMAEKWRRTKKPLDEGERGE